jgi:hypothetical protein
MWTLEERNCVVQSEEKTYRLGLKLWELGSAFLEQSDLQDDASSYMQHPAGVCGESVFLSVLDGEEVVYVRRMESPKSAVVVRKLGQRAPIYCTDTGLSMLAFLSQAEIDRVLDSLELEPLQGLGIVPTSRCEKLLDRVPFGDHYQMNLDSKEIPLFAGDVSPKALVRHCTRQKRSGSKNRTGLTSSSKVVSSIATSADTSPVRYALRTIHHWRSPSLAFSLIILGGTEPG